MGAGPTVQYRLSPHLRVNGQWPGTADLAPRVLSEAALYGPLRDPTVLPPLLDDSDRVDSIVYVATSSAPAAVPPPPLRVFRILSIPFWGLLGATLLPAIPVLICGPLRWRYRWRMGHCPRCGYDLSSLPDARCPECGRYFDRQRQQVHRARWLQRAVYANERLRRYNASRWRHIVAVLCVVTAITAALIWLLGAWRFTYRAGAFTGYFARGHTILVAYPIGLPTSPDDPIATSNAAEAGWSASEFEGFNTIWRPYPLLKGNTLYLPAWSALLLSALLWVVAYRPFYRFRWRGVRQEVVPVT